MRLFLFVTLMCIGHDVGCQALRRLRRFGQTLDVDIAKKKENNVARLEGSNIYCITEDGNSGRCVDVSVCNTSPGPKTSSGCPKNECCIVKDIGDVFGNKPSDEENSGDLEITQTHSNDTTELTEYPYVIALHNASKGESVTMQSYIGIGTLIHPSVVLTVAHKVDTKRSSEIKCRAGKWKIAEDDEVYYAQDRDVEKIVVHNEYENVQYYFDAALLFTKSPFKTTAKHIRVACLGENLPPPDTLCSTVGWGNSFTDENSSALKKMQMSTVEPARCQMQLRNTHLSVEFTFHYSFMCAAVSGVDTGIGDGGAPLVCSLERNANKPVVYGIVALRPSSIPGTPWVFAKIPALEDWLTTELEKEGKNATYC